MEDVSSLIALDWGTSNLRAYLLSESGQVLAERDDNRGIMNVPGQDFEAVLTSLTADWRNGKTETLPIIASGMITSKQGWIETGYLPCPVDAKQLANGLKHHPLKDGGCIYFVPGLSYDPATGWPDVMRGEEVQILGASSASANNLFVLPGTHSKWVQMSDGLIDRFRTFMTGELFSILKEHSILGRLMDSAADDPAGFEIGVRRAQSGGADELLASLFSARSLALFDRLPAAQIESYLSGLLIGTEISEGHGIFGLDQGEVIIVGSDKLVDLYQNAFAIFEIDAHRLDKPAAVVGLHRIAVAAGLIT
jgi:2-dehydro-3-deoxygalactonokinase